MGRPPRISDGPGAAGLTSLFLRLFYGQVSPLPIGIAYYHRVFAHPAPLNRRTTRLGIHVTQYFRLAGTALFPH